MTVPKNFRKAVTDAQSMILFHQRLNGIQNPSAKRDYIRNALRRGIISNYQAKLLAGVYGLGDVK